MNIFDLQHLFSNFRALSEPLPKIDFHIALGEFATQKFDNMN
jgi:hypothetical protein